VSRTVLHSPLVPFALAQLLGKARPHVAIVRQENLQLVKEWEDPQPPPVRLDEERGDDWTAEHRQ